MELSVETEVLKQSFFDLSMIDKIKFIEWLHKEHKAVFEYSQLDHGQRKIWNHYYPDCSEAEGYFTTNMSGLAGENR
jgi:hypothetical protein